ncbi:hypothetical protein R7M92_17345 [Vibrio sp. Vb2880]|uniref:hypothetical protein n=1 Tax=Vibrio TaxID=662 RepID=UPI0010BDC6B4|nr:MULTISPECIES: hypothetical protein [Vibrio]MCS0125186.1 hypothetical protein [Vibrio alginolyticus]MDA0408998.1 hypothetical protein [Vibrio alginolyticus]MDW1577548.1 hypothetical protein [Vibrio sp. Vb2880]MDW3155518.1 hypothetical protein [Vibrio sp. 779(2023)]TKF02950.1 hypothetical protein FCV48_25425 [Vibrio alginolyticus]
MFKKFLLKSLVKFKARERVYLGSKSSLENNDMYFIWAKDSKKYYLESIEGENVLTFHYPDPDSDDAETHKIPFSQLSQYDLLIKHHYRLWQLEYTTLLSAYIYNVLGINRVKWFFEQSRDKKTISYYERFELLSVVLKHRDASNKVNFYALKREIYGNSSENRTDYTHNMDLRWKLLALQESGDVSFKDEVLHLSNITVNPQALNTLSAYQREERKHRDSIRMARIQQTIAFLLFISAVINVYFTHIADKGT